MNPRNGTVRLSLAQPDMRIVFGRTMGYGHAERNKNLSDRPLTGDFFLGVFQLWHYAPALGMDGSVGLRVPSR